MKVDLYFSVIYYQFQKRIFKRVFLRLEKILLMKIMKTCLFLIASKHRSPFSHQDEKINY